MTISIAWVATRSDGREDLYFASDSRTRGARVLDVSPKVLMLPRTDAAISFAGDTIAAYPMMMQISNAIAAHQPALQRNLDVSELKKHLLRVLTDMLASVQDFAQGFDTTDGQFLFGGYSWRSKRFRTRRQNCSYRVGGRSSRGNSGRSASGFTGSSFLAASESMDSEPRIEVSVGRTA